MCEQLLHAVLFVFAPQTVSHLFLITDRQFIVITYNIYYIYLYNALLFFLRSILPLPTSAVHGGLESNPIFVEWEVKIAEINTIEV
jgi:hypothetical protein